MARALLVLVLITTPVAAGPAASLTGVDMRTEHAARRAAFAREMDDGVAVFFSLPHRGYGGYRPEPNLFWLTGVERTGAALVIHVDYPKATDRARKARGVANHLEETLPLLRRLEMKARHLKDPETRDRVRGEVKKAMEARATAIALYESERGPVRVTERLYLPPANPRAGRWTGPRLAVGPDAATATGVAEVRSMRKLYGDLGALVGKRTRLFALSRSLLPESARTWLRKREASTPDISIRDPARLLGRLRGVKSAEEIARIRRACELTAIGLTECMQQARPGMFEYEFQARLEFACRRGGSPRQAFASIVGSGPNGTILHYMRNNRKTETGDLVLMDVGAEFRGYAADVTRTFPVNGRFTKRQAEIYDIVLAAQKAAFAAVRPGVSFREVNAAARKVITEAGYGKAFLHSVGHYVGLDVHDPSPGGPFRPGTVITVEPGIYLAREGIGIRIEDTVLVTKDGREVLSGGVVKSRVEIEALMR